ncbi:MAG TPA: ornithine cyclodeaminase family protein [Gemmatimonadaceae bacterium]|nr:ornithine cyclodeaminase family protein [Gemmatimonadaceae bacterium]
MLVLGRADVAGLLPMRKCIALMADALGSLARGEVILPLRPVIRIPDTPNAFAVMPAYSAALPAIGAKLISVFPENHGTDLDSHQGVVTLFDAQRGNLSAILDAASITAIRTAAVSGLATSLLARADSRCVAIVGSGVQARTHVDAMLAALPFERVVIWGRTRTHADRLAHDLGRDVGAEVIVEDQIERAVRNADVVCTVTASREPVVRGDWVRPGTHINAVGASLPNARELDTAAVQKARIFVDRRESALNEAGDLLIPMREGAIAADAIVGELGEVFIGKVAGRQAADEITLFKSLGLAVEDLACAAFLAGQAAREGAGTWIEL